MKKLLFILNPNAGMRQARRALADVIGIFSQQGWLSSVCVTGKRGDATDFARAYGGEVELVVCAGGDGTLNETVTGLLQEDIRRRWVTFLVAAQTILPPA